MRLHSKKMLFMTASVAMLLAILAVPLQAQDDGDQSVVQPGVCFGSTRIGGSEAAVRHTLGKPAGNYSLPGGVQVDYWSIENGATRDFYRRGVIIQISDSDTDLAEPVPGNIMFTSSLAQVRKAYPGVRLREYHENGGGGGGVLDYWDDARHGITFEFTRSNIGGEKLRMYAVIVHKVGMPVIPDAGETPN